MSFIDGRFVEHNERLLRLLSVCRRAPSIARTKALHALTITLCVSLHQPVFVRNNILHLYTSHGHFISAANVFDKMPDRNAVSFNTLIGAYSKCGDVEKALDVFSKMRALGFLPTRFTIAGLLSCVSLGVLAGVQLHGLSLRNGLFWADAFVGTSLLCFYGRSGLLEMAMRTFEDMSSKSLVTWNSMMSLLGQNGYMDESLSLFRELVRMRASLSECSLLAVLSGVDSEIGEQLHCLGLKKGLDREISVANSLIGAYGKCRNGRAAEKIFEEAVSRDIISWNAILTASAKRESPLKALTLFANMLEQGFSPNESTFVSVVNSCAHTEMLMFGRTIHGMAIKNGYEANVFVGSALIDLYVKCDILEDSQLCFDNISEKNVVSWNSLISGYAKQDSSVCISLCVSMLRLDFWPSESTFAAFLKSCRTPELKQLHSMIIKMGYEDNDYVLSSLTASYAKNGQMSDTLVLHDGSTASFSAVSSNIIAAMYSRSGQYLESVKLISTLEQPDAISWNIAMAACSRAAKHSEALLLFKHMLQSDISPDNYSYSSVLSTCTALCDLALGSSIHGLITKTDFLRADTFVCNLLINMYGKCGSIRSAVKIFEETGEKKNLITWTALITSLGIHGYVHEAFEKFGEMVSQGFKPDRVSFISMLTVCRHGGLVREGMGLIQTMKSEYGVEPDMEHYRCGVDLLVRNGNTKEAEEFIAEMPFPPDASVWRTFLEGCKRSTEQQNIRRVSSLEPYGFITS